MAFETIVRPAVIVDTSPKARAAPAIPRPNDEPFNSRSSLRLNFMTSCSRGAVIALNHAVYLALKRPAGHSIELLPSQPATCRRPMGPLKVPAVMRLRNSSRAGAVPGLYDLRQKKTGQDRLRRHSQPACVYRTVHRRLRAFLVTDRARPATVQHQPAQPGFERASEASRATSGSLCIAACVHVRARAMRPSFSISDLDCRAESIASSAYCQY